MTPTELSRTERAALRLVQRFGVARFVALTTAGVVVSSLLLVTLVVAKEEGFRDPEIWISSLLTTAIVPLIVAPPITWFLARLVHHLALTSEALRSASVTDALTGILNRRGFFETVADLRSGADGLEVGMIDLDHFKALNDEHGHALGDRALQVVAQWLRHSLGDGAVVGRLGGDEFAYALPLHGEFGGPPLRQRFRVDGVEFDATIGRARCRKACSVERALAAADGALFTHKRHRDLVAPTAGPALTTPAEPVPGTESRSVFAVA